MIKIPDITKQLIIKGDAVFITSRQVAEFFEKRHDHVLRDIEELDIPDKFRAPNFGVSSYQSEQNRKLKQYYLTRDGFIFLTMGYHTPKANLIKIQLLEAFSKMESLLRQREENRSKEMWETTRATGKSMRALETSVIKRLVKYATNQGSKNAQKYYMNISKMENKALGFLRSSLPKGTNLRDLLNIVQLGYIQTADSIVAKALQEGMDREMYYKDIYQFAKQKVEKFADIVGESSIGDSPEETLSFDGSINTISED